MTSIETISALWRESRRLVAEGRGDEALAALARLRTVEPGLTDAHLLSAAVAYTQGRLRDAAGYALGASRTDIHDAATLANTVMALLRTGELAQAHICMQGPILASRLPGPMLLRLANAYQAMECHADALDLIDRAISGGTDDKTVRFLRSIELMFNGRGEEAGKELERSLAMGETAGRAMLMLARQRRQTETSNHIEGIRDRLGRVAPGSEDQAALEFALYKEHEDLDRYEDAWHALQRGNRIMASRLRPDAARHSRLIDGLIEWTADVSARTMAAASDDRSPQPIFIVGMPRSGTTLLDRILGAHSRVTSVGELGDFARQLRWAADHAGTEPIDEQLLDRLDRIDFAEVGSRYLLQSRWRSSTERYIDKLPVNYQLAGLIAHALPQARILHMVRDPLATCFSNYRAYFGAGYGYSYDLGTLASHYNDYRRLMRHWHHLFPGRILDVEYQRLTSEPESVARRVTAFCGLDFEPECLELKNNRSPIATLSAMQMDMGIRPSNDDSWRRYAPWISTLASALDA